MIRRFLPVVMLFVSVSIGASDYLTYMDIQVDVFPHEERMAVHVTMHFGPSASGKKPYFLLAPPKRIGECIDLTTGKAVQYEVEPAPEIYRQYGYGSVEFKLPEFSGALKVAFDYEYDGSGYTGYGLNPGTWDNLLYGQITAHSVFSSHLFYYPFPYGDEVLESAMLAISVPAGWKAVSSGNLVAEEARCDRAIFRYRCDFESGILAYPLAIYPYESLGFTYDNRFPVTLFFTPEDLAYAQERSTLLEESILPFLEGLMGPYPFEELRIVEVFPTTGNTGLATERLVMMSRKIFFGSPIDGDYRKAGAAVLVDEIAHQWNYYKVGFPVYFAEAVSQYTDLLYPEQVYGRTYINSAITRMSEEYVRISERLRRVRELREKGKSQAEAARALHESPADIAALWPFAERGEVPVSDPGVLYTLYFYKGAVALHALRNRLGDDVFFESFRNIFKGG